MPTGNAKGNMSMVRPEVVSKKKQLEAQLITKQVNPFVAKPQKILLSEFFRRWLAECCKNRVSTKTLVDYTWLCENHIVPTLGTYWISDITPANIQMLYGQKIKSGLSTRTVQYIHRVLSMALKHAVALDYLYRNPADVVRAPHLRRVKDIRVWTQEQANQFLEVAESDELYAMYVLALSSGMRAGELFGLWWDSVNLREGSVTIRRAQKEIQGKIVIGDVKTKASRRTIFLPKSAADVLRQHRENQSCSGDMENFVFTSSHGAHLRRSNVARRSFKPLIGKAGVPEIRFHDMRHTHATLLLQQGVSPKLVQERLGHSSITLTLDTYSDVLPNMQSGCPEGAGDLMLIGGINAN